MMDDFNIDYSQMHCQTNPLHVSLKHFMSMFGMFQLINSTTRITSTTSTILDLILISDPAKISQCGIRPWLKRSPTNILYTQMQ